MNTEQNQIYSSDLLTSWKAGSTEQSFGARKRRPRGRLLGSKPQKI